MDEDHDRMYVGSKDYILSLDLHDINKEPLIVSFYMNIELDKLNMSLRQSEPFIFLHQIHWPVASQRKTECILSGKDTNVSTRVEKRKKIMNI